MKPRLGNAIRAAAVYVCTIVVLISGCSTEQVVVADQVISKGIIENISTDKASYLPGKKVKFSLTLKQPYRNLEIIVQYRHLEKLIDRRKLRASGDEAVWEWMPPKDDFKGYMAEVFVSEETIEDHANIAVDVSSDWSKFPRYGFLSDFSKMGQQRMENVIERLNRFHINGLQFYDWQYKHHDPIKLTDGEPAREWPDIAKRPVAYDTVKGYIGLAHAKNMRAMNYNLIFGAYEDAAEDGVKQEWGLFKGRNRSEQDKHPLPGWASDIMLYNPDNPEWQQYLIEKEKRVFDLLPFDGWHVDQLGDRGTVLDADGKSVRLSQGYVSFLKAAKQSLDVDYVMNAVDQYGQGLLAALAPLDFLYSEVWSYPTYEHLKDIIDQNNNLSRGRLNTVLAAYINYERSAKGIGTFNAPGVLFADAVIFASGGAHLELGEHMLSHEYFPIKNLSVPPQLDDQLIRYYDFLTAYQNILRDGLEESKLSVESPDGPEITGRAQQGKIWSFAKRKDGSEIVHFINFTDATSLEWRDNMGDQAEPKELHDVGVVFPSDEKVKGIMFASPDYYNGSAVELAFEQRNGQVYVTLPHLKYWDMMKIDYKQR
ncbi:glycoside hydrolase family 66 protein [Paenibacillus thermotolerans]|uniref:glycoside hydrolase family 66 protein n=1 Tax=Paenibacillus thermotolerans TaxID=3027807 RepID=UPI002367C5B3|nr:MULTISPECIES: glycoside hydrolase family 66 protein [unclassified Paenibacillus]